MNLATLIRSESEARLRNAAPVSDFRFEGAPFGSVQSCCPNHLAGSLLEQEERQVNEDRVSHSAIALTNQAKRLSDAGTKPRTRGVRLSDGLGCMDIEQC